MAGANCPDRRVFLFTYTYEKENEKTGGGLKKIFILYYLSG